MRHLPAGTGREPVRPFSGPWHLPSPFPARSQRRTLWLEPGAEVFARHGGGRLVRCGGAVASGVSRCRDGVGIASQSSATGRALPGRRAHHVYLLRRRPQWQRPESGPMLEHPVAPRRRGSPARRVAGGARSCQFLRRRRQRRRFPTLPGKGAPMTFRTIYRTGLPASQSPFRVVDEQECEVEWINRFLDMQCIRGIAPLTLRSYANMLLHFVRWWCRQPGVDGTRFSAGQFTESTLVDYVRDQLNEQPKPGPENVNQRSSMLRRLFRFYFHEEMPHGPYRMQRVWFRRSPLGYGRGRAAAAADLTLKVPQRVIVPLSAEQVARFWGSFRTARDLALVALMLLNGLRSREVLALKLEDLLFSEAQIRVPGKGARVRLLPLPPETIRLLQCYLKTERPLTNAAAVFVS